jgi:hypothetical protein
MIYVANPYIGTNKEMSNRYEHTCAYVAKLCREYQICYAPIVHFHAVAICHELPRDSNYWRACNVAMLRRSEALHVLQLDGWDQSDGVKFEMDLAAKLNLLIRLIRWPE